MSRPRIEITVSYRVLDSKKGVLYMGKETGFNKNLIQWKLERWALRRFGKGIEIHIYKVQKTP